MQENIIHMDYRKKVDAFKIGSTPSNCDTIEPYLISKGNSGERKPSKPKDYRLIGKLGKIKLPM